MEVYLKQVSKKFKDKVVLDHIDVTFSSGKIIGLIGPNGVGKTTLMRIMVNLDTHYGGTIEFGQLSNQNEKVFKYVTFLQDNRTLYPQLTAYDHLMFLANVHNLSKERVTDIVSLFQLDEYLHKRVKSYSLGMKQNLLIAMAHLPNAQCMIMDEPLNGLDPSKVIEFKQMIRKNKEKGITQIISTHNLSLIQDVTDEAYFLKQGQLEKIDVTDFNQDKYILTVDKLEQARIILTNAQLSFDNIDNYLMIKGDLSPYFQVLAQHQIFVQSCQIVHQSLEDAFKELYH